MVAEGENTTGNMFSGSIWKHANILILGLSITHQYLFLINVSEVLCRRSVILHTSK